MAMGMMRGQEKKFEDVTCQNCKHWDNKYDKCLKGMDIYCDEFEVK